MKKRLLYLALAICMVAAMLPTMVLSAGAEGETYNKFVYQFGAYLYGQAHNTDWKTNTAQVDYSDLIGRMSYNNSYNVTAAKAQANARLDIACSVGSWIAFDIIVPVTDTYDVTFEGTKRTNGLAGEVYILPGGLDLSNVEAIRANWSDNRIISDLAASASYTQAPTTLDYGWSATAASGSLKGLKLSAGVNTVLLYAVAESDKGTVNTQMNPVSITITSSDAPADATYSSAYAGAVEADKQEIALGETATAKAYIGAVPSAKSTATAPVEPVLISDYAFESSNTNVATVDPQSGAITPKSPGKTTISAVYTGSEYTRGYILSTEVDVYKKSQFAYNFGSKDGAVGYNGKSLANAAISEITYGDTAGLWKYYAGYANDAYLLKGGCLRICTSAAHPWIAMKINVPESGKYNLYSIANTDPNGGKGGAYLLKATPEHEKYIEDENIAAALADSNTITIYKDLDYSNFTQEASHNVVLSNSVAKANVPLEKGEYILIFNASEAGAGGGWYQTPSSLFMIEARAKETKDTYASVQTSAVILDTYSVELGKVANAMVNKRNGYSVYSPYRTVNYENYPLTQLTSGVTYKSTNPTVATVNASTGAITTLSAGTTEIIATLSDGTEAIGATLTVTAPAEDEDITNAFETEAPVATVYNPSVSGTGYNASGNSAIVEGITKTLQADGSYKMYAPETSGDAKFLYWAKGLSLNKKIVSYSNEFYYTPAGGENNILIAAYDDAESSANKAEFYNANGQLIKIITDAGDDKTVPALPSMAGYNNASAWKQYNGETEVAAGEDITPIGTMIFVAQYGNEAPVDVTVEVKNGNGSATIPYGTEVICTPDASKGTFKWWKKEINGVSEIVSIDETYKFLAWENCTVTAEYGTEKPIYTGNKMKIVIDSFTAGNAKAVMAEFIGFGADTVEKGIICNGTKIAMTRPGNQFTVTAEIGDILRGYAIVKNGTGYNLIVDGEVTLSENK